MSLDIQCYLLVHHIDNDSFTNRSIDLPNLFHQITKLKSLSTHCYLTNRQQYNHNNKTIIPKWAKGASAQPRQQRVNNLSRRQNIGGKRHFAKRHISNHRHWIGMRCFKKFGRVIDILVTWIWRGWEFNVISCYDEFQ